MFGGKFKKKDFLLGNGNSVFQHKEKDYFFHIGIIQKSTFFFRKNEFYFFHTK